MYNAPNNHPLYPIKISAQSHDTMRHPWGSQHKIGKKKKKGRGQHMSSQRTTPRKTTVPTKQIGFLLQLQSGVACSCVCMHVVHFTVLCVCVYITRVTYNTTQVKIGQNSRRAAWADLGVALRVCTVASISNDMTGLEPRFFFRSFIILQVQVMRLEG